MTYAPVPADKCGVVTLSRTGGAGVADCVGAGVPLSLGLVTGVVGVVTGGTVVPPGVVYVGVGVGVVEGVTEGVGDGATARASPAAAVWICMDGVSGT